MSGVVSLKLWQCGFTNAFVFFVCQGASSNSVFIQSEMKFSEAIQVKLYINAFKLVCLWPRYSWRLRTKKSSWQPGQFSNYCHIRLAISTHCLQVMRSDVFSLSLPVLSVWTTLWINFYLFIGYLNQACDSLSGNNAHPPPPFLFLHYSSVWTRTVNPTVEKLQESFSMCFCAVPCFFFGQ